MSLIEQEVRLACKPGARLSGASTLYQRMIPVRKQGSPTRRTDCHPLLIEDIIAAPGVFHADVLPGRAHRDFVLSEEILDRSPRLRLPSVVSTPSVMTRA